MYRVAVEYIDILTLSETHIKKSENVDNLYAIPGYNFESRNRSTGFGGGVAVYIRETLNYIRRFDLESSELENIVIEIVINNSKNILLSTYYRPPNTLKYLHKNFNELFEQSLISYCSESKETIVLGDMNTDYLKRNDNVNVKSIINRNGFTQIIDKPTRITEQSKTLIDIIATNRPENIVKSDVIATSLSDHDLVACVRKLNNRKFPKKTVRCRNYRTYDPEQMKSDLKNVNWNSVTTAPNVN